MNRDLVVTGILGLVFLLALLIVVGIVLRPWADANTGANTKLNLMEEAPLEYGRTPAALVWQKNSSVPLWQPSGVPGEDGLTDYIAYGCALCHGIDAQGGVVAGPLAGFSEDILQFFVRLGPEGMPAYSEEELPPEKLKAIADWLASYEDNQDNA